MNNVYFEACSLTEFQLISKHSNMSANNNRLTQGRRTNLCTNLLFEKNQVKKKISNFQSSHIIYYSIL